MRETEAQIQTMLNVVGEDLEFTFGTIKGIPGHLVYNVQNFDSPYDIEKQDVDFQISYNDFYENVIANGDTFSYLVNETQYNFEITSYVADLTGWVQLRVKLLTVEG